MYYQQQKHFNDCGPACLVMLVSYYQLSIDLSTMKRLCNMNLFGTNLKGLLTASQSLGFKSYAFKGIVTEESIHIVPTPYIAHVSKSFFGIKIKHYVVVNYSDTYHIEIYDPNPKIGIKKITITEFLQIWTGYIIIIS